MSISPIQDIVKMVEQVPNQLAYYFINALNSIMSSLASVASKHLESARQRQQDDNLPAASKEKYPFKRPPFLDPNLLPGKENKIADIDSEMDKNDLRMKR